MDEGAIGVDHHSLFGFHVSLQLAELTAIAGCRHLPPPGLPGSLQQLSFPLRQATDLAVADLHRQQMRHGGPHILVAEIGAFEPRAPGAFFRAMRPLKIDEDFAQSRIHLDEAG
jgi:hypothetical protein